MNRQQKKTNKKKGICGRSTKQWFAFKSQSINLSPWDVQFRHPPHHRSVAVTIRAVGWTRQCGVPELPRVLPRGPPGGDRGRRGRVLRSGGHSPNPPPKLTHIPVGLICTHSVEILVCYIPLFVPMQGMVHPRGGYQVGPLYPKLKRISRKWFFSPPILHQTVA